MTGYPVILGGDHAAFEAEWSASGRPDNERPDWPLPSFDARDWAAAFCKIAKTHGHDLDEEWMVTWFANALMRGFDEHAARSSHGAREFVAEWMIKRGYATGHGDSIGDLLTELEGEANDHGARGIPPRRRIDTE
jgi:hypothetical protein